MTRLLLLMAVLLPLSPAAAAPLVLSKSSVVVADQINLLNPKALPNASIDYAIRVDNPNGVLSGQTIGAVIVQDTIPNDVVLRVADYGGTGSGPVEYSDGGLLGLLGSGLGYSYGGLASATDGLEFFDGTSWAYAPVADAQGYDARVRAIRIKLTGAQAAGSAFRLRFRVRVK